MTFEDILGDLKKKVFKPVYFLQGEEPYFIDVISDYIEENALSEDEKAFNQTIVYGKEIDTLTLVSTAKRYPMMASYQVVIVKEAQDLKDLDKLVPYIEQPLPSTILVFCYKYKTVDKRTAFGKLISSKSVFFTSDKLYENKVPAWINQYVHAKKYQINTKAGLLLTEYLGNDLGKISNELDKLMLNVPPATEININHIEKYIGISKEYNIFELQSALGKRDVLKANKIVNYFAANPKDNPFVVSVATLFGFFSKILIYHTLPDKSHKAVAAELKVNPYFVTEYEATARNYPVQKLVDIIGYLRQYDLKSKGVDNANTPEGSLLKELVFKILH